MKMQCTAIPPPLAANMIGIFFFEKKKSKIPIIFAEGGRTAAYCIVSLYFKSKMALKVTGIIILAPSCG